MSDQMVEQASLPQVAESSGALKDITFGSIAGMTSKLFEHPFDLVKVRLQSQPTDRPPAFKGPLDCFKQTWGKEGAKGLYRGVSAPIVGAAAENACLFLIYNRIQEIIRNNSRAGHTIFGSPIVVDPEEGGVLSEKARGKRREMSMGELAMAAGMAGAFASFVLTPIELVKCTMQVQALAREGAFGSATKTPLHAASTIKPSSLAAAGLKHATSLSNPLSTLKSPITTRARPPLEGPATIIRSVIAQHGIRGLWLGQVGTLFRETGGSAAWFSAYEIVSRAFLSYHTKNGRTATDPLTGERVALSKKDLSTWELVLAGASAGMSYNIVLFPADCVKSAMQTQAELRKHDPDALHQKARPAPKFFAVAKDIYRSRGIRGLYAGCGVTVMRSAPSSAMIFLIYETLESKFGHYF